MTRTLVTVAVAVACLTVAGCGGNGAELQDADPLGYEACSMTAEGRSSTDAETTMELLFAVGPVAAEAETPAIRRAVDPLMEEWELDDLDVDAETVATLSQLMVDVEAMVAACEAAGYEMPEAVEKE